MYTTSREESLKKVAEKHGVDVQTLIRLNRGRMQGLRASAVLLEIVSDGMRWAGRPAAVLLLVAGPVAGVPPGLS